MRCPSRSAFILLVPGLLGVSPAARAEDVPEPREVPRYAAIRYQECAFFFRQSAQDAVYTPPGDVLVSPSDSRARYTGAQLSLSLGHRATRHLMFNAEYSHVVAGSALQAVTGRDVDFFGTWTTFTY